MVTNYEDLINPLRLGIERRAIFNYYLKALNIDLSSNNVYACFQEGDAWDTRIVDKNTNKLYRFSNPKYTNDINKLGDIRSIISFLQKENLCAISQLGVIENQVWFERDFFEKDELLSFELLNIKNEIIGETISSATMAQKLLEILESVKILWENKIYHGDISEYNIVKNGSKYVLVDPVFSFTFSNNRLPEKKDDINSLAKLISNILINSNFFNLQDVIEIIKIGDIEEAIYFLKESQNVVPTPMSSGVIIKKKEDIENDRQIKEAEKRREERVEERNNAYNSFQQEAKIPSGKIFNEGQANFQENVGYQEAFQQQNYNPYQNVSNNSRSTWHGENLYQVQNYPLPSANQNRSSSLDNKIIYFLLACLVGVLIFYNKDKLPSINLWGNSREKLMDYEYAWTSNKPVLMKEVLNEALKGDKYAEATIINFSQDKKNSSPYITSSVLNVIFNPLWEEELSSDDKYTAFRISMPKLISQEEKEVSLKTLDELHPAVSLSVAGNVSLDAENPQLKNVSLEKMSKLKGYYGESFKRLSIIGGKNLDEISSRALSSILVKGENEESIISFLAGGENIDPLKLRAKIYILLDLSNQKVLSKKKIYEITKQYFAKYLNEYLEFFNTSDWKGVSEENQLKILTGVMPDDLEILQYIDLLSYPLKKIRKEASQILSFSKALNGKILEFISDGNSKLTRKQVYVLLSSFLIEKEKQSAVVGSFFSENPDNSAVLKIMLIRNNVGEEDSFNFEAARYLSHSDIELSENEIKELVNHPEPMARAIGYSRLDLSNPTHKKFMEERRHSEKSDMLKVLIAKRLG